MEQTPAIVVLEDESWRTNQMRRVAHDSLAEYECWFFDNASELQSWLGLHLWRTRLISLDCDLDTVDAHTEGNVGSGSDVVDYLAGLAPACPVIIHSSNAMRAPAMHLNLTLAGWPSVRLSPYTDAELWLTDVLDALSENQT